MNNHHSWQPLLANILVRESRSLLQFVGEAFPWARSDQQPALVKLQRLIAEESQAAMSLSNFLRKQRITPPALGAYPISFASWLFVALDFLLPQLVEHQRRAIAELERDLGQITCAAARQPVENILALKQRHLKELEELTAQPAKAAHA